ncbi:hypothetical protein EC5412_3728, partial [Escherichia coli 5412]|jgi:hypothetical protein
MYK